MPWAQSGWQSLVFNRPVPCPPVPSLHPLHVMDVIVVTPNAHAIISLAGRTFGVGVGPHDRTPGIAAAADVVVVVVDEVPVAVDPCVVVEDRP